MRGKERKSLWIRYELWVLVLVSFQSLCQLLKKKPASQPDTTYIVVIFSNLNSIQSKIMNECAILIFFFQLLPTRRWLDMTKINLGKTRFSFVCRWRLCKLAPFFHLCFTWFLRFNFFTFLLLNLVESFFLFILPWFGSCFWRKTPHVMVLFCCSGGH